MNLKQSEILLVVAVVLTMTIVASAGISSAQESNISLLRFMSRSTNAMQRNPLRSTACFGHYIPLIDQLAKNYESTHTACLGASKDGRFQAEEATLGKRNDLALHAQTSCDLLSQCSQIAAAENVFECYVEAGSENARTMYDVNRNASESLADLIEEFRLVTNREFKCTNDTKRQYEKESAQAYKDLNKCILGIIDVPTTTEAPGETTESTESPATTESPASTESTESSEGPQSPESTAITESPEQPERTGIQAVERGPKQEVIEPLKQLNPIFNKRIYKY